MENQTLTSTRSLSDVSAERQSLLEQLSKIQAEEKALLAASKLPKVKVTFQLDKQLKDGFFQKAGDGKATQTLESLLSDYVTGESTGLKSIERAITEIALQQNKPVRSVQMEVLSELKARIRPLQ